MAVRILHDQERDVATLYCSSTDWAFGPVAGEKHEREANERLQSFLEWHPGDVRHLSDAELVAAWQAWQAQEEDQYAKERLADLETDEDNGALLDTEVEELAALRARFATTPLVAE
jgi:hypothetical protein